MVCATRTLAAAAAALAPLALAVSAQAAAARSWSASHEAAAVRGGHYTLLELESLPVQHRLQLAGTLTVRRQSDAGRCYAVQVRTTPEESPRWHTAAFGCEPERPGRRTEIAFDETLPYDGAGGFRPRVRICYVDPADAHTCGSAATLG